jgi:hypothetical protein
MKTFLKILLGFVCFVALAIAAVFYFTANMVSVADDFFTAVKSKDIDKAYSCLSEDFKAATSREVLNDFLNKNGLNGFKSSSWAERSVSGSRGTLTGTISTETGGAIPIKLSFAKGDSGWKIYSIEKPPAGIQEEKPKQEGQPAGIQPDKPAQQPLSTSEQGKTPETPPARNVPSIDDQAKMVAATMHVFAVSVNEKSMAKFHAYCSGLMQRQYTVQKLDEIFTSFFDLGADLTLLDNLSPSFDEKAIINENGVLVIKGRYPTQPSQVYFEQKYITEGQGWKVVGINVNVK